MAQKEVVLVVSMHTPFMQVKKDSQYCRYMLEKKGCEYEEVDAGVDWERRDALLARSGASALPQVFIDGE